MEVQHIMERIKVTDDLESLLPGDPLLRTPSVRHDSPPEEALRIMRRHKLSSLPVLRHRRLIGLVTRQRAEDAVETPDEAEASSAGVHRLGLLGEDADE